MPKSDRLAGHCSSTVANRLIRMLRSNWILVTLVPENTQAIGDLQVRTLAPFSCATVLHSGRTHQVEQTQTELQQAALAAGIKLSGETREYYLYWEAPSSENTLILVAAGVSN